MLNIEQQINMLSDIARNERSNYHVTLGDMIDFLEKNTDCLISLHSPHSYRGYYSDLAFEKCEPQLAMNLLKTIKDEVLDKVFEGYKGGEYTMHKDVPVWVAEWGCCGEALLFLQKVNNEIHLITKDV